MTSADSKEIHSWLRWRLRWKCTFEAYKDTCTNTTTTYNGLKIDEANDLQTEKKELARVAV